MFGELPTLEHLPSPGSGIHALYISPMSAQAPISTLRSQQGVHKCREKAPDDPANVALNQLWSKWPSTVKPHCFQQLSTTVWGDVVYNSESTVGVSNRFQTVSHIALRKADRGGVSRSRRRKPIAAALAVAGRPHTRLARPRRLS